MDDSKDTRTLCKYDPKCYQKNSEHQKKYKHSLPHNEQGSTKKTKRRCSSKNEKGEENNGEVSEKIVVLDLPTDVKEKIKFLFLVDMPDDFYEFFEFCKSLSPKSPKSALKSLNLELTGPFDALCGTIKDCTKDELLRHSRYYFDPPEFQTVLKGDDTDQLHYGYFRDDPNSLPNFVAKNNAAIDATISCVAGNMFGAVKVHANEILNTADIFRRTQIQKIQSGLIKWAKNKKISLDTVTPEIKARRSKIVAKTFNTIGVVVPYDKKTDIGYRSLPVTSEELKKILRKVCSATSESEKDIAWSHLQPVITAASIANDESDFGTSLELGINMFAFGEESLHQVIQQVLCVTYKLLQRNQFAEILVAHLKKRSKSPSSNLFF